MCSTARGSVRSRGGARSQRRSAEGEGCVCAALSFPAKLWRWVAARREFPAGGARDAGCSMRVRPAPCCHEHADFCSGALFSRKKSSLTHGPLRSAHWKTKTRSNMKLSVDTTHSSKPSGAEYISGKVGAVSSERGAESAVSGAESARSGADSEKSGAASAKHGGAPAKHASTASTAGGKTPKTRGKDPAVMVAAACGCAPPAAVLRFTVSWYAAAHLIRVHLFAGSIGKARRSQNPDETKAQRSARGRTREMR